MKSLEERQKERAARLNVDTDERMTQAENEQRKAKKATTEQTDADTQTKTRQRAAQSPADGETAPVGKPAAGWTPNA